MTKGNLFLKINYLTIGSVLVLILVGSIVRSTGAGMGCPDWPKCFGSYIPPTSADQLPDNYLEIFKAQRLQKNQKLSNTLVSMGYTELADRILNDPFIQTEQDFNVTKAWIEYVNRLIGVLIGFFVFLNMIFSFQHRSSNLWIPVLGVVVFVLTGFQGWVGSLVVSTNLLEGFISFHMILALVILALLIWMNVRSRKLSVTGDRELFFLSFALLLIFIPQLLMGLEVRGVIDKLLVSNTGRINWIDRLPSIFLYHRSYSWIILLGSLVILSRTRRKKLNDLVPATRYLLAMVGGIGIVGVMMTRFDFPMWTQPMHLILATGIFSVLFYLILRLKPA